MKTKALTQDQGYKLAARLHRELNEARTAGDAVKVDELEKAIEKLAE
jgi:hypothetical protein